MKTKSTNPEVSMKTKPTNPEVSMKTKPSKKNKKNKPQKTVIAPESISTELQVEQESGFWPAVIKKLLFTHKLVLRFGPHYFVGVQPGESLHTALCKIPTTEVVSVWGYSGCGNVSYPMVYRDKDNNQVLETVTRILPNHSCITKFDFKKVTNTPNNFEAMEYTWDNFVSQIVAYSRDDLSEIIEDAEIIADDLGLTLNQLYTPDYGQRGPGQTLRNEGEIQELAAGHAEEIHSKILNNPIEPEQKSRLKRKRKNAIKNANNSRMSNAKT